MQRFADETAQLSHNVKIQNREPIERLGDGLNRESPIEELQRVQALVMRISDGCLRRGWPPLRLQASNFSQNGPKSYFEVNWLRTDLLPSTKSGSYRTRATHGPGFRLVIGGYEAPTVRMQSRHNIESRNVFIKNVLNTASLSWIERCLGGLRRARVYVRWTDECLRIKNMDELHELAVVVNTSKKFNSMKPSYFIAWKSLEKDFQDVSRSPKLIVDFFTRTAPLFWGHVMMLEPKAARTIKQPRGQVSREHLRKDVLKLEKRSQHADCPLNGGDPRKLKMAHLTPRINVLSNVIALLPPLL